MNNFDIDSSDNDGGGESEGKRRRWWNGERWEKGKGLRQKDKEMDKQEKVT